MRYLSGCILTACIAMNATAETKTYDWDFSIVDDPQASFTEFTDANGFGFETPKEALSSVCTDTYAPAKIAIRTDAGLAVYNCSEWRAGNQQPEVQTLIQ